MGKTISVTVVSGAIAVLALNTVQYFWPEFSHAVLGAEEAKVALGTLFAAAGQWLFPNAPAS